MPANVAGIRLVLDDGTDLADKVNPRLVSLTLSEKRGGEADELSLTLHNADGKLAAPSPGRKLTLALGWATSAGEVTAGLVDKGQFTVDEVEESGPPDVITIKARSADLTGAYRQRQTKAWKNTTVGAVLGEIAARHGVSAQVHPDLAGKPIASLDQHGKSDAALVADLGRRFDAVATWKGGSLIFMPHGSATTASGKAIPTITLTKRQGWAWRCSHAERAEAHGVQAEWYDAEAGHRRRVNVGEGHHYRLKHVYGSEAEAKQAAEAHAKAGGRKASTFEYDLALADMAMQPNGKVKLSGWSTAIDARTWLLATVETTFSADGLKQRITLETE